jgi:WhiB family redox-sensing transcriptional regulator
VDPEVFFPPQGEAGRDVAADARETCAGCDVREQCLAWALAHSVDHGVWGGLTGHERKALRAVRRRDRVTSGG